MSNKNIDSIKHHILLCEGKSCTKHGSDSLLHILKEKLLHGKKEKSVLITKVYCTGNCKRSPIMVLYPEGTWYGKLTPKILKKIIKKHIKKGKPFQSHIFGTVDSQ